MKLQKHNMLLLLLMVTASTFAQINYGEALQKSLLFYETQQSGILPSWNRISWRSDAGVNDGADVGLDLTGGWHDAGDHIKFGFPMAYSVSALNWGFLEYQEGYEKTNQVENYKNNIKWVTDYFIKCHPSPNELYVQVADSKSQDHNFWMPPEMVDVHPEYGQRLSYKITPSNPGTEVACETAAALASASIVFKDSDPNYSATLLRHAIELYNFGDAFRGKYTDKKDKGGGEIPADGTYSSGGYEDELSWGALWLYRATGEQKWLDKAEQEYTQPDFKWSFVWDDKRYGNMVMLSIITKKQNYIDDVKRHLDFWQPNGGVNYSPGGQAHLTEWGSSRHAMNAALTALIFVDNVNTDKNDIYYNFAVNQVNYVLGDNPMDRSLVTGFGKNPPTKPHHRGMHASWSRSSELPVESRHTLIGALMGGPIAPNDTFVEDRDDFQANEVATDYNACYTGVLARMVMEFGGEPLQNFPQPETPGLEYLNEIKINGEATKYTEVSIWLNNRSAWPARVPQTLSARYFVDITEGVDLGLTSDDYILTARGAGGLSNPKLQEWDATNNIYYAEVEINDPVNMPFPGGMGEYRKEIQLRISAPTSAPAAAWDPNNDPSYDGLDGTVKQNDNTSIYENGVLVNGNEPAGIGVLKAGFTASKLSGVAPVDVSFDASKSREPDNGSLTYTWDFGDGTTATGVTANKTFTEIREYVVTLTITNANNESDSTSTIIRATDAKSCSFGAPMESALPTLDNSAYSNVHIIGENGPDFSNVREFNINYDAPNHGLYTIAIQTTNGNPDYYVNLTDKTTFKLNSAQPELTIQGSGFANFDDSYWVAMDEGNFVLVSRTRELTIYFSSSAQAPECVASGTTLSNDDFNNPDLGIAFFPNPADKLLNIKLNNTSTSLDVAVYSITGLNINNFSINANTNQYSYDVSNLSNGMYILKCKTNNGEQIIKKIIVSHN